MAVVNPVTGERYIPPVTQPHASSPNASATDNQPTPEQTKKFVDQSAQTALNDAKAATTNYENSVNNGAPKAEQDKLFDEMKQKWGIYTYWLEEQLRIAKLSGGQAAVNQVIANAQAQFNGSNDQYLTNTVLPTVFNQAKSAVLGESTEHSQTEIDLVKIQVAQQNVATAVQNKENLDKKIPADIRTANPEIDQEQNQAINQATQGYIGSLKTLHDDLVKELGLPANFTDKQLTDALNKLKAAHKGEGLDALIDSIGAEFKVNRNLNNINPNDPTLSPIEKQLAQTDPVSLAFIQSAGVSLDPKDYNTTNPKDPNYLSPQELDLMKKNPMLFALMRLAHISVRTSANGVGVDVTVNGKPAQNMNATEQNAAQSGDVDTLVTSLVQRTQWSPDIQALMQATDMARLNYATTQMKQLMSGKNPDIQKALQFLTTNLDGMFSQDSRAALWQQAGLPYFNKDWVKQQIAQLMKRPDPLSSDPKDQAALQSTEINADKVGRWMQQTLKNAPPELANIILDVVESKFDQSWYQSNRSGDGTLPNFVDFYKGLSMAVQLAPDRAQEVTDWLLNPNGPQAGILPALRGSGTGLGFQSVRETVSEDYGWVLSETLLNSMKNSSSQVSESMTQDFELMLTQGEGTLIDNYMLKINREHYLNFMNDPGKVLNPFFDQYQKDAKIGTPQKITSDTQLHDLIGQALGLKPFDQKAADAQDFNKEWYKPGTPEWNIINLITQWIHQEGGKNPTVTVLPFVYASEKAGINNGVLFQITKPDGSQEVIDGTAAVNAINANNGQAVDPNNVNFQWHYANFQNFEENNPLDPDGYIYLPTNFRIGDNNHDGHVDWTRYTAHIVTPGERARQIGSYVLTGAAIAGTALLIFATGGWAAAGLGLFLVGTAGSVGLSIDHLNRMGSHGESTNFFTNPEAQADYINIAGNIAAALTFGTGKAFVKLAEMGAMSTTMAGDTTLPLLTRLALEQRGLSLLSKAALLSKISKVSGYFSTGIGIHQAGGQFTNLIQNWGQMTPEQRAEGVLLLGAGLAQFFIGGKQFKPESAPELGFEDLVKGRANLLFEAGGKNGKVEDYYAQASQDVWAPIIKANALQLRLDDPTLSVNDSLSRAKQEIQNLIALRARALWRAKGRPAGKDETFWLQAESEIFQRGGKPFELTRTTEPNQQEFLNKNAYYLSEDDPSRSPATNYIQAVQELHDSIALRARELWREAGRPTGKDDVFWLQAEKEIFGPAPAQAQPTALQVNKFLQTLNNWSNGWKRRPDPNDPAAVSASKTAPSRFSEYRSQLGSYFKVTAGIYLTTNIVAAIGAAIYYSIPAQRKPSPGTPQLTPGNAYSELQALQNDPDEYLARNYDNYFNSNGHLLEIKPGSSPFYSFTNEPYYFRRVPYDLYQALVNSNDSRVSKSHTYTDKAGNKTTLNGVFVTQTIQDANGKWVDITVEIRPPWWNERGRDFGTVVWPGSGGTAGKGFDPWSPGFRWRPQFGFGPIEGMRFHIDAEVLLNDRYSTPTATTLRVGLPSITQGWGVGIRQQNTSLWSRLNFSMNAIDINAAKVIDLTNPGSPFSSTEWMAFNGRLYVDIGNRDRVRLDFTGKDLTGKMPNGQPTLTPATYYARFRETGFVEVGAGADIFRIAFSNGSSISLNGYYEFQYYIPDLRRQFNFLNDGITMNQGLQPIPPLFEIDPALQFTISGDVPWFRNIIPRLVPSISGVTAS